MCVDFNNTYYKHIFIMNALKHRHAPERRENNYIYTYVRVIRRKRKCVDLSSCQCNKVN